MKRLFNRQAFATNLFLCSSTSDLDSPTRGGSKIKGLIEYYEMKSSSNTIYDSVTRDSVSEINENRVMDLIEKFETYMQNMRKYCTPKINREKLFYCCLIFEKFKDVFQIKYKFPSSVEIPQNMEHLCFPESDGIPLDTTNTAQTYSLLLTSDTGERTYGYCRRVLPEGCSRCLPLVYCILSKHRAPRFYKRILVELESRHGIQDKFRDNLISQFYNHKFPKPGESIKINLTNIEPNNWIDNKENYKKSVELFSYVQVRKTGEFCIVTESNTSEKVEEIFINDSDVNNFFKSPNYLVVNERRTELVLTLHPDTRYDDSDLITLHNLPAGILLKIFSSMLLERKVIFVSSIISKLSSCMDCLQSIIYPFTWHHTFIPILPKALWDIVESPTPVICGVLSSDVVLYHQIENGIVVDLDSRCVLKEEGNEDLIMSKRMKTLWKQSIKKVTNKSTASMDRAHFAYLSDAYLQVFIMCFKDYKKYFVDGVFQREEFIRNGETKGTRRFLKMFTETYMFSAFVDTILNSPENLIEFDKKIVLNSHRK